MNHLKRLALVVCIVLLPLKASAQWLVIDPSAIMQEVLQYYLTEALGGQTNGFLSSITGISQNQLTTQGLINQAIGTVGVSLDPGSLTSTMAALTQGIGLDVNGQPLQIYTNTGPFSGSLDVFMGTNAQSFQSQNGEGGLLLNYYQNANGESMGNIGMSLGLGNGKINFLKACANMDANTRQANSVSIAHGLAEASNEDFINSGALRRQAIQTEANLGTKAAKRSANSQSANETAASTAEQIASAERMAAIHAQQANLAAETQIIQGDATNRSLKDMDNNTARARAEELLAKKAGGNTD